MFCKNCGSQLTGDEKFCKNCGSIVQISSENVASNNEKVDQINNHNNNQNEINTSLNNEINNNLDNINTGLNNEVNNNLNNMNIPTSDNETKKKSKLPLIITFVVLGLVIVGLTIFIIVNLTKDNNVTNDKPPVIENNGNNDGNKNETPSKKDDIITITNYDYTKLDGYDYAIKDNKLYVKNNTSDFISVLSNVGGLFSSVEPKMESLKQYFINSGYTVNNSYSATYGTTKYLVFETLYSGKNIVIFYAEHPDATTVVGSLQVKETYTYEKAFEDISKIINSSTKTTDTSNNNDNDDESESFNVDISDILE